MKTVYLHEINLTVKYQKLKRGSFFHVIILTTLFRDGSLYVLAILKIYENIYEIQQNEIFNKNWIHSQQ